MTSRDLTSDQAERTRAQVARHLRFLNRLVDRMTRAGFPPDDELFVAAIRARATMQDLHVACHYASVKSGVGADAKE